MSEPGLAHRSPPVPKPVLTPHLSAKARIVSGAKLCRAVLSFFIIYRFRGCEE